MEEELRNVARRRQSSAAPSEQRGHEQDAVGTSGTSQLPIQKHREDILAAVRGCRVTIIIAPTGSGKSTEVPRMLLSERGLTGPASIWCTQPRRIAAASLANRVAQLTNTIVGDTVGYRIGGCSMVSRKTRLIYAVTAIALGQCLGEDSMCSHLIIDEFHIRDVFIDLLLAAVMCQTLRRTSHMKVILMSAAMDIELIRNYVTRCAGEEPRILDLKQCRLYPLQEQFLDDLPAMSDNLIAKFACKHGNPSWSSLLGADLEPEESADLVAHIIGQQDSDRRWASQGLNAFLVFLPGRRELILLQGLLRENKRLRLKAIYGGQTVEVQQEVLQHSQGEQRLVILATDVLESSVTLPDVDVVLDTCVHRRPRWNQNVKNSLLTTISISKDEATQRAGRTGRLRPGHVLRLISKTNYAELEPHVEPEILHTRLEEVLLTLFDRHVGRPREFLQQLPTPPKPEQVDQAFLRLLELGALRREQLGGVPRLTHFGRFLHRLPLDPQVGGLVMNGVRYGVVEECAIIAAVTQRGEPFIEVADRPTQEVLRYWAVREACARDLPGQWYPSDLIAAMRAYQAWRQKCAQEGESWPLHAEWEWCTQHYLSLTRLHEMEEMVHQIREVLADLRYSSGLDQEARRRLQRRRREMLAPGLQIPAPSAPRGPSAPSGPSGGAGEPELDIQELLGLSDDHRKLLLVRWSLAAAFSAGTADVRGGLMTESAQVKYVPARDRQKEIVPFLRKHGFKMKGETVGGRGDVFVTFQSPQEARKALQVAALPSGDQPPFLHAAAWMQGKYARPVWRARQCYMKDSTNFRVVPNSVTHPLPARHITVVAAGLLPVVGATRMGVSYMCSKCSLLPAGVLPFILAATYPAATVVQQTRHLHLQFQGVKETLPFSDCDSEIMQRVDLIRAKMDLELGRGEEEVRKAVEERAKAAGYIMEHFLTSAPEAPRDMAGSFLQALDAADLSAFELD